MTKFWWQTAQTHLRCRMATKMSQVDSHKLNILNKCYVSVLNEGISVPLTTLKVAVS